MSMRDQICGTFWRKKKKTIRTREYTRAVKERGARLRETTQKIRMSTRTSECAGKCVNTRSDSTAGMKYDYAENNVEAHAAPT